MEYGTLTSNYDFSVDFIKRGSWRYACVECSNCRDIKELRVDFWNKLVRENKEYTCRECGVVAMATRHGFSINSKTKKSVDNWLYRRWQNMKKRCRTYNTYVARGIKVCEEWENDFLAFKRWAEAANAQESLELDRRDNDKGYSPDNCRWVSHKENCRSGGRSGKFSR